MNPSSFRFAIASTFTAEPLEPVLRFWAEHVHEPIEPVFAPYNQPFQTLLDPAGIFAANHRGINILLVRLEDLGTHQPGELAAAVRDTARLRTVPLIVCLCPPANGLASAAEAQLRDGVAHVPGVAWLDYHEIARLYPVAAPLHDHGETIARIPYTELYYCALGTALVRRALALTRRPLKLIALDCDDTLWRGICGEDGPAGVVLDAPRRALHELMLRKREEGVLLAMVSRNNEQDVLQTFAAHPEMPLQLHHFTARKINWNEKPDNLAEIARELGLGLDSFAFVDDNPKECAEVRENEPEVLALALPPDAERIPQFLEHVWAFDSLPLTAEDRTRAASYQGVQEFGRELRESVSLQDFVRSLQLDVRIEPLTTDDVRRVAQLTQRTNQFNLSTLRRTEAEVAALLGSEQQCWTVRVADRFGDYGLTGVVIFSIDGALHLETLLLSCRVLGRGVAHRILARLAEEALRNDAGHIVARAVPSAKNQPALQFFDSLTPDYEQDGDARVYRLPAEALSGLEWQPAAQAAARPEAAPRHSNHAALDYDYIAGHLNTANAIYTAMLDRTRLAAGAFASPTEEQLAAIWADLLQHPGVQASDNFFDLGGHSLLVVMLVMRVRDTFGVELPVDDVYTPGLTLAELATRIEGYQLRDVSPQEYQALLERIESLSDEEVEALLAGRDPL